MTMLTSRGAAELPGRIGGVAGGGPVAQATAIVTTATPTAAEISEEGGRRCGTHKSVRAGALTPLHATGDLGS